MREKRAWSAARVVARVPPTILIVTLAAVVIGCLAIPASGHAIVRSTLPEDDDLLTEGPQQVVMHFNEPVETNFGALRVFDGTGRRVDDGVARRPGGAPTAVAVDLKPDLPDGTYTVSWRVVSADGHPIEEAFVFHVGAPGAQPQGLADQVLAGEARAGLLEAALLRTARWVAFAALLVVLGGMIFLVAIWHRSGAGRVPEVETMFMRRWRGLMVAAWAALMGATLAAFVFQGAVAANVPLLDALSPAVLFQVLGTRFGQVAALRVLLLGIAAVAWLQLRPRLSSGRPALGASVRTHGVPRPLAAFVVLVGIVLAATPALEGHAGTTTPVVANVVADAVHLIAAAAWFAGLVLLLIAAFPAVKQVSHEERGPVAAPVVARFSDLAMLAVGVLVVTGVFRAWVEVRAFDALFGEPYGLVLLAKLAVFAPLLALGAVNNRFLKPRLLAAGEGGVVPTRALSLLRRTVTTEVALVVIVLAVTAVLVNVAPARVTAMTTAVFSQRTTLGDHPVRITVEPGRTGENTVTVMVLGEEAHEPPFEGLEVRFSMPEREIGPLVAQATAHESGHYAVEGHHLSVPGEWHLEIVAHLDRFTNASTTVAVPVDG